jgi:hypothetical protein
MNQKELGIVQRLQQQERERLLEFRHRQEKSCEPVVRLAAPRYSGLSARRPAHCFYLSLDTQGVLLHGRPKPR